MVGSLAKVQGVTIGGRAFKIVEDTEKSGWLRAYMSQMPTSDFKSIEEFTASLNNVIAANSPKKVQEVFHQTLGGNDDVLFSTATFARELAAFVPNGAAAMVAISKQGAKPEYIGIGTSKVEGGQKVDENSSALIGSGAIDPCT